MTGGFGDILKSCAMASGQKAAETATGLIGFTLTAVFKSGQFFSKADSLGAGTSCQLCSGAAYTRYKPVKRKYALSLTATQTPHNCPPTAY
jgi:hypothetical protein